MENEIELKVMLLPQNISLIESWLAEQKILEQREDSLANTYYDNSELYFAKNKMGLRVRTQNEKNEITLKMKGEIVGGLHIRPEYNLDLPDNTPDLAKLIAHFNLDIEPVESLIATFSTDFVRRSWLIEYQQSQIEIALDQGLIKNDSGEDQICEIEFELKQGNLADLVQLLERMPKADGMWLSSLSKAQRGYLVGKADMINQEVTKLLERDIHALSQFKKYQLAQQVADFLRLEINDELIKLYSALTGINLAEEERDYLISEKYLVENIQQTKKLHIL
ncbi:adenylate cyclase [Pasteurellaceae bacterium LFhippo2]|nr:adenylate cyclase [Pasteurellaceae bacterium LFhippo2]